MSMAEPVVAVTGLAKAFAGRTVIRDVTLTIRPGEVVGLVGANGGGKTTTLRMLAGLMRPDAGEGRVLGAPVGQAGTVERRRIGYMGQRLSLYPDLTVAEMLGFHAAVHDLPKAATVARAIDDYALAPVIRQRCATLSGGWARRVQFAATVLAAPALLLLDEPTAGLDVATRRDIWRWIEMLAAEGCGVAISTHDLIEAERCPSILLYHDGVAEEQQPPATFTRAVGAASLEAAVLAVAEGVRR